MKKLVIFLALCSLSLGVMAQGADNLPCEMLHVSSGRISFKSHDFCVLIKNQEELTGFWQEYSRHAEGVPSMPVVDFQNKMLAAIMIKDESFGCKCLYPPMDLRSVAMQGNSIAITFGYADKVFSCLDVAGYFYVLYIYVLCLDKTDLPIDVYTGDKDAVIHGQSYTQWLNELKASQDQEAKNAAAKMPSGGRF